MIEKATRLRRDLRRRAALLTAAAAICAPGRALAQEPAAAGCDGAALTCRVGDRVVYLSGFFARYNPVTALDMVERVPGFSIDAGEDVRGFGGAAGNVLIDGQRPSTKSADIFEILGRIGAGNVERIELIRGGTGGLDVAGQTVVVNVVTKKDQAGGEPSPWSFSLTKRRPDGGVRPGGEVAYSGRARGVKYTIGGEVFATSLKFGGPEEITRFFGDDEMRVRDGVFREQGGGANLKLEKPFEGGDVLRFNFESAFVKLREDFAETRFLVMGGPDVALFTFPLEFFEYELGADYEHAFTDNFDVKLIALFGRENEKFESGFEFLPAAGEREESLFISDETRGETIGRIEFDWKGWERHVIQFGGEIARNYIDSKAEFFVDDGSGVLAPQMIDGANTRVSELRGETFAKDSWAASPALTVDAGFALELSRIAQSGDADNSRFFVYPKPSLTFTYNINQKLQLRLSGKREVNQLSFDEFVTSVNFDDEAFEFGNPEFRPQASWQFEAGAERRFGEIGVVKLAGFYHVIQDVEDFVPVGGTVEIAGNIGDGSAWGGKLDLTAPLDPLGLQNARLESSLVLQRSSVRDPVTGVDREISFFSPYQYEVEFRQDFPEHKVSWGWSIANFGEEKGFGLDETLAFTFEPELDAYIETTVVEGVKVRLAANDILNVTVTRDRTVFDGSRAMGVPLFREVRGNQNGGGITLTLSGTF